MSSELDALRKEIDTVDEKIVALLAERMHIVDVIGAYKKHNQMEASDPKRHSELLESRERWAETHGLSRDLVHDIFERIHTESIEREKRA